ncbi:hypothetical protein TSOC_009879, partial [Tetrabaena socialis]
RPFSDHLPVSLTLNLPVSEGVRAAAVQSRPARVRFDVRGWRRYSAAFAADDAAALAALQDIKEALKLGEVNSTIAVERISGIVAKEMIKVFGRRRPAGLAQEDATWWNAECQQARDTMRERDAARRGGTGTQEAFLASRRAYHQAKRLARAAHDASTYRDFVSSCRTDPRTLWRALEEGERQRCPLADCALFREHFRTLLNAGAEVGPEGPSRADELLNFISRAEATEGSLAEALGRIWERHFGVIP